MVLGFARWRSVALSALVMVTPACTPLSWMPPDMTVVREAPIGTFSPRTTFELASTFADVALDDAMHARMTRGVDLGAANAESEFRRETFLTNPLLANRSTPPSHRVELTGEHFDGRGPFAKLSGSLRIVDRAGVVLEEVVFDVHADRRTEKYETAEAVASALGYRAGVYMVCRTSDHPDRCRPATSR